MSHAPEYDSETRFGGSKFRPLLALIVSSPHCELAGYIEYLIHENKIFWARIPRQICTTMSERETLLKYGKQVGQAIHELITIVSPLTFQRRVKQWPTDTAGFALVIGRKLETNVFETKRIIHESRKLGIKNFSRQTGRNILKEHGLEPGLDRTSD